MGTATWSLEKAGQKNNNVRSRFVASGAHTTSITASNLTDGAAGAGSAVTARDGDILTIQVDEAARLMFSGTAATATLGSIIFAAETANFEVPGDGTISIIDIA